MTTTVTERRPTAEETARVAQALGRPVGQLEQTVSVLNFRLQLMVGREVKVRLGGNAFVTGRVKEAWLAGWRLRQRSAKHVWGLRLVCGAAEAERVVYVETLPKIF